MATVAACYLRADYRNASERVITEKGLPRLCSGAFHVLAYCADERSPVIMLDLQRPPAPGLRTLTQTAPHVAVFLFMDCT
jgi:hypothetical protein